jgi:hypothetical protein
MPVIIGKILEGEKTVRFNLDIHCTNCGKQVPGGMKTGERYYLSEEFKMEQEVFLKNYLCGICRDKKRRND